ncbi:ATP-dependent helicase [Peribacillus huizhouensis]|uniref:DNA 3'-5' helicase n=1 Tax=Peribacillus huizhouensis TaxID=1501239 RepID=A0ABR6CJB4_9BACI|nr:ATP-dependent helicase [Peribacillus huizhouensis]MBA9025156.1 DNA helicase-2/ATP-dependent DNA helicase PcrA [Peribacillus huizhouensis]
MQAAKIKNEIINLTNISAEQLQELYVQGKRGELSCPSCGLPVKLLLGISHPPHFSHVSPGIADCSVPALDVTIEQYNPILIDYKEENGFKIPKSRTITKEQPAHVPFKRSTSITGNPEFTKVKQSPLLIEDPYFDKLYNHGVSLDKEQTAAATTIDGPLLVLSGAGSGKTRVLTVRTAYMLTAKNINPKSIMLVTFTAKAAKEMKERLLSYPEMTPMLVNQLVTGTFHSIFYKILLFHEPDKWRRDLLMKWEWERTRILKIAGKEIGLDEKDFAYDQALQQIGLWKNSLLFPNEIKAKDEWETSCLSLYKSYEEYKLQTGSYDFDDMLIGCYSFFRNNPDVLAKYQKRFDYFLIDEFQDINKVQYELIQFLSARTKNVCVVGDDDQAIYAFRGSDPSFILHFERDFPGATVIKLTENYRSSHEIVASANRMIKKNQNRHPKTMKAQYNNGNPTLFFYPYDEETEATMIVHDIQERITEGANPSDFAILYRTHAMSRAIFERLATSNLPFIIEKDADSFYERRIVKSMLAYLRLSSHPEEANPVGDVLSSLFLKQSVLQDMKAQTILQDCDFIEALAFVKTAHPFQERKLKSLPKIIRSLKGMTPAAALLVIEKEIGFADFVKKRGNEGNIEKGSDDIRDLKVAAKRFHSVPEFLEHVDHMTAMVHEVKQLAKHFHDAVQLTTIHRSKGLEYKYVYVLGAVDGSLPHDFALESHRQGDTEPLEEERRLLYVAMTRAKDGLFLSIPQTRRGKTAYPSRFLRF